MINNDDNAKGIFVLNGQMFSVNDLINVMRRHGLRIDMTRNGLAIDGEQITSISNLDGNKCPLAGTCEKRIALVEFLKLQKTQGTRDQNYDFIEPPYLQSSQQSSQYEYRSKEPRNDFIKPNNHDLFEGNVSQSRGLFDEPEVETEMRGLFDEPDFYSDSEEPLFEGSLFNENNNQNRDLPRDRQFSNSSNYNETHTVENNYCNKCGFDLNPSWNSCPNCGQRITQRSNRNNNDYFY